MLDASGRGVRCAHVWDTGPLLAGERKADAAADVAIKMPDLAVGMKSGRVQDRIIAVRDAVNAHADGTVARDLPDRVQDLIGRG